MLYPVELRGPMPPALAKVTSPVIADATLRQTVMRPVAKPVMLPALPLSRPVMVHGR